MECRGRVLGLHRIDYDMFWGQTKSGKKEEARHLGGGQVEK